MSAGPVEIRRLSPEEAGLYRDIRLEGLRGDPDAFGGTIESEGGEGLPAFADRLARLVVFGAFRGPELLGVAGFSIQQGPKQAHKGLLWGMYVRPGARRLGVGKQLVEAVLEHARSRVELIQLRVISGNLPARRLYAGQGFEEYGIEKHAAKYHGRYNDDVLMAKPLMPEEKAESRR